MGPRAPTLLPRALGVAGVTCVPPARAGSRPRAPCPDPGGWPTGGRWRLGQAEARKGVANPERDAQVAPTRGACSGKAGPPDPWGGWAPAPRGLAVARGLRWRGCQCPSLSSEGPATSCSRPGEGAVPPSGARSLRGEGRCPGAQTAATPPSASAARGARCREPSG